MTLLRPGARRCLGPLLLLLWLPACSSGGEAVTPEAYAAAVCGAVGSWQEDLGAATADLQGEAAATTDPAGLRAALVASLAESTARTDRLVDEVVAAGTPSGEGGEVVAREVQARVEEARRLFDTARTEAEGSESIAAPLGGPARSPVRDALRNEPGCGGLAG